MEHIVIPDNATALPPGPEEKLQVTMRRARLALALVTIGLGGSLAVIPISSAVIASGQVTVASRVKKIAHPRGGVVAAIPVSNGDYVRAGEVLMRLDSNVSAASAAMTAQSIEQLLAREARLRAERDGLAAIAFPQALISRGAEPSVAQAMTEERRTFTLNRASIAGQRATLQQQVHQAESSIESYRVQADSLRQQEALIAEERDANERLWEKRFTTLQRRNELIRAAVGLHGSVAMAEANAAQMISRIAELRERMLVLTGEARSRAGAELAQVQTRLTEMKQNNVVAQDANDRNLIRAPYDGVIDKLVYSTIGGVVPAGETIMEIVPNRDPLVVTARVSPAEIDELRVGEQVSLRFSAFNLQTTPQIAGKLTRIGADSSVDPVHGIAYFPVEIEISRHELARLGGLKLRPGMPVEAFIRTGERTLLAFILKPLTDQIARTFR